MMHIRFLLLLVLVGVLAQGCDRSGIYPLGVATNTVSNCGKSTWARSTDTGTELFVLSETDPTSAVAEPTDENAAASNCFLRIFIEHDSTTTMEQGTYSLGADGTGVFTVEHSYIFEYQDPSVVIGQRDGAIRNDTPMPASHAIQIDTDGTQVLLGVDGDVRRLTNLYDVIARTSGDTQEDAEDVFRVLNLVIYSSAVRIPGFGSVGMTSYINNTTTFTGLIANQFTVGVTGTLSPVTDIIFGQFEDLSGIVLDGDQHTETDLKGNGHLEGVLDWRFRGSDSPNDVFLEGTLDYEGLKTKNGVAGDGTYTLTVEGTPYTIPYTLAADMDLRNVLPVETP
jgi:hypothetical protein